MMKNKIKIVAIVGMVALVALTFFESRQMAQTQVQTAGQKFKNIKVLNDMPADQMGQVMNMMSASLGFNCAGCHAAGDKDFDKDTNEHKVVARKMLEMTFALNKQFFEGKPEVSCNTCHNGRERPVAVPNLLPTAPVERPKQPAVKPLIDDILAKYSASLGSKESLAKVTSRQIKANRVEPDMKTIEPEEIWQKNGKFRSDVQYGGYVVSEVFDGKNVWKRGGNAPIELKASEMEQIKRDAMVFANPDLKSVYTKLDYRFMDRIDGRDVYVVQATTADNQRERLVFDVATGALVRRVASSMTILGQFQYQVDYSDFKEFGGVKLPATTRFAVPNISWVRKITEVKNIGVDDAKFAQPK